MRIRCLVLVAVAAIGLLAGCGGGEDTEGAEKAAAECPRKVPVPTPEDSRKPQQGTDGTREAWITLNGYHGPENVGILMAAERDYFADAGILMTITSPVDPDNTLGYLREGTVDLAVSYQPEVVMAGEEEKPVVAVGALISRPTAAMIWLRESGIRDIADLEGKTIAVPGVRFQEGLLRSSLKRAGLTLADVELRKVGFNLVPALISGRADAIFGGSRNMEGAELRSRGLEPVITPVQSLGVPAYDELVVVARPDYLSEEPRLIRDFMAAVARGNAAAMEDPEGAVELIEKSPETNPRTGPRVTEAQVRATLPLLSKSGYMDPDRASDLADWMCGQELIERKPPTSALLTNAYLAPRP